jgi:O-antigen ligase
MPQPRTIPAFPCVSTPEAFTLADRGRARNVRMSVARWLNISIFCGLLALIPLTAIPYGTVQPGWQAVFECSVFALGALSVLQGFLSGQWRVRSLGLLAPLMALILLSCFQILPSRPISADPFETRLFISRLLALVLAAELLLCYTTTRQRLQAVIQVVISVGVASALFGIARQTMQGATMGFILPSLEPGSGYGQFINRNHFAFLMEMTLGLLLGLIMARGITRDRILTYLALAAPVWAALVLSNSRGGIVSMLCQILFLALFFGGVVREKTGFERRTRSFGDRFAKITRPAVVRLALVLGLFLSVVIGVLWLGGDPLVTRLESASKEVAAGTANDSSATGGSRENINRREIWLATWRLIKANPVTGVGFGGYWTAIAEHHDASGSSTPQQAHNDYLELWASGGPVAIGLAAWFVFVLIKRARRRLASSDPFRRAACFGSLASLFTVAIHSFVDFGLHITVNALICIVLVVIATVDYEEVAADHAGQKRYSFAVFKKLAVRAGENSCNSEASR